MFKPELDEAFNNKEIKIYRNSTMQSVCYRYFIVSEEQKMKFLVDRELGSVIPNTIYHVYVDDDSDRTSPQYQALFIN